MTRKALGAKICRAYTYVYIDVHKIDIEQRHKLHLLCVFTTSKVLSDELNYVGCLTIYI